MADMLDYIRWRGDLPFTVSPPNEVDAVIFSTLSYIPFRGRAAFHPEEAIPFSEAVEEFFSYPEPPDYVRAQRDLDLLKAAGESVRFGNTRITEYRPKFIKEQVPSLQESRFCWMTAACSSHFVAQTIRWWAGRRT